MGGLCCRRPEVGEGEVVAKSLAQSRPGTGTGSRFAVLIQSRERRSDDSSFADKQ